MRCWATDSATTDKANCDRKEAQPMKKRVLALALILCLSLTGCASLLEREYVVVSPYRPVSNLSDSSSALRVESYQELVNAVLYLVTIGEEQGVLNLYNYTQDVEADLNRACLEVLQEDPLGAYSVEQITHNYSLIVSYYEVNLQITYRRSREQVGSIAAVTGSSAIRSVISSALTSFAPESVLRISYFTEDEDYIRTLVEQAYYDSPATALGMPETQISIYPNSGSQRIVEIMLTYPLSAQTLRQQNRILTDLASILVTEEATAQSLCDSITNGLTISPDSGRSSTYDALVKKDTDSEGAALAYQFLCDQAGIECYLVRGFLNESVHFWNIVRGGDGQYRHMDLSAGLSGLSDPELTAHAAYLWDTREYPVCPAPDPEEENLPGEKVEEN